MALAARPTPPRTSAGPTEHPADVAAEARLLAALADAPAVARGWVLRAPAPDGAADATLLVEWGQRDLPSNKMRKFATSHALLRGDRAQTLLPPPPPPSPVAGDVVLSSPSPSGARQLVIRAPPPPPPSKANRPTDAPLTVEVWGAGRCLLELSVPPTIHGAIWGDGTWFGLGGATWSGDEGRVAYVAEAPPSVPTPEWGTEVLPLPAAASEAAAVPAGHADGVMEASTAPTAAPRGWRGVGPHDEDWGEALTGCRSPAVFVLDTASATLLPVPLPPAASPGDAPPSAGQPALSRDGSVCVYAAWAPRSSTFPALPQRLGITYCTNRPCALWRAELPPVTGGKAAETSPPTLLTPSLLSALSPRFNPENSRLAFLSHDAAAASGVHNATAALHVLPWDAGASAPAGPARAVAPVVSAPSTADDFPGLYAAALPPRPWIDAATLALTTQWGPSSDVVLVDVCTGRVVRVSDRAAFCGAWSFLGAGGGWLAATVSLPSTPPDVVVLDTAITRPRWRRAARADGAPPPLRAPADAAVAGVASIVLDAPSPDGHSVQAIAVLPPGVTLHGRSHPLPPAVLVPHGGPHTAHTDGWFLPTALLVGLGYTVLLVNFRGSTGYGEAALQSLPGRIGDADVADCIAVLDAAIAGKLADPARVAAVGGSHGGFLVGNLLGKHASRFKAGVMRNPVCDISVMAGGGGSDILDWCWIEAYGSKEGLARASVTPTAADIARFQEVSPIACVDTVTSPILMLLGGRDRRVPMVDAKRYVNALRARRGAPPARVLIFGADTHALDTPQTEFEAWLNAAAWLKEHVLGGGGGGSG